ncbi:MAG: hypothetical protein GF333_07130 [Candidatus Omnitrophica bacterium]|nr:hypothetical protein [Candidatus Omnitrophota bacterium]
MKRFLVVFPALWIMFLGAQAQELPQIKITEANIRTYMNITRELDQALRPSGEGNGDGTNVRNYREMQEVLNKYELTEMEYSVLAARVLSAWMQAEQMTQYRESLDSPFISKNPLGGPPLTPEELAVVKKHLPELNEMSQELDVYRSGGTRIQIP